MEKGAHKEPVKKGQRPEDIKSLAVEGQPYDVQRARVVGFLKPKFLDQKAQIARALKQRKITGLEAARRLSDVMDETITALDRLAREEVFQTGGRTSSEHICLVATGGYGRRQLAFYSDIDVMFLIPYKPGPWVEKVTEFMLQVLWDLGLTVGHALRTGDDCIQMAEGDISIKTSLLDARYLTGEKKLFEKFEKKFRKKIISGKGRQFVEDKLEERDRRHQRMGNSRYVVEPNLKEGKGGLRDLHTLFWLARFLYRVEDISGLVLKKIFTSKELETFRRAENFLWTVRQHLHLQNGRAEERVTFDMQLALAKEFRYQDHPGLNKVERFMKHYFLIAKDVGDLTRIFCALLEERHQKKSLLDWAPLPLKTKVEGFRLVGGRLTVADKKDFQKNPANMIRIFAVADRHGYDIHPDALKLITSHRQLIDARLRRDPAACDAFMEVLTSRHDPETSLRRMNEAGVLGRFITDFGRAVAQTQHDMYHYYTVDEHTIRAIGILARIEKGQLNEVQTLGSEITGTIMSRSALYMALFLHDIAKGRGGDHSELGEQIAHSLCPRLGFTKGETDLVAWLVRDHLLMSNVAFKRDLSDDETIKTFTKKVKTLERLRLLAVLTIADIMAVGPKIWTAWKHRLLSDLYEISKPWFSQESIKKARAAQNREKKEALARVLKKERVSGLKDLLALFPENYWMADRTSIQAQEAVLVKRHSGNKIAVEIGPQEGSEIFRVSVVSQDGSGLFSNLAGALASFGINILDARGFTLTDRRRLTSFVVENPPSDLFSSKEKQKKLKTVLRSLAVDELQSFQIVRKKSLIRDRRTVFEVPSRVRFDNQVSSAFTLLEVKGRDKIGLLHQLAQVLVRHGCAIFNAHVATFGDRAVDVFYLQDRDGKKILDPEKLDEMETALRQAITGKKP